MSTSRSIRLLVGLLSAALLGLVPVALAGPAHAAPDTRIQAQSPRKATFGAKFSVTGQVQHNDGSSWETVPSESGSVKLQRRLKGRTTWKTLEVDDYGNSFYFYPVKAVANATYRLQYSGGTDYEGVTYSPSKATQQLKVRRAIPVKVTDRLVMKGKVKPAWKRKPVIIQKRKGKRWVRYAKVRTNKKSRFHKKLHAVRRKTFFRAFVKKNKQYVASTSDVWWTKRLSRTTAPRVSAR
jgi:hypothetical protein